MDLEVTLSAQLVCKKLEPGHRIFIGGSDHNGRVGSGFHTLLAKDKQFEMCDAPRI